MEAVAQLPNVTARELKYVQCCRLFLQVTTLADITTSDGSRLCDWVTTYSMHNPRLPTFLYPNQERPNRTIWNIFVRKIRLCFTTGTNDRLCTPLGRWYRGRIQQIWPQVYSPSTGRVYTFENNVTRTYTHRRRQHQYHYEQRLPTATFPVDAILISGSFTQGHFIADTTITTGFCTPPAPTDTQALRTEAMLRGTRLFVPPEEIAQSIWKGTTLFGTDGSVSGEQGTYAIVLFINTDSPEPTTAMKLGGWMNPLAPHLDLDSHRPEAAALYAALVYVSRFLEMHPQPTIGPLPYAVALRFILDNQSMTNDIDYELDLTSSVFDYIRANYDILQGIQRELLHLLIRTSI
jgi:hypothetical protein